MSLPTLGELVQGWLLGFSGLAIYALALAIEDAHAAYWRVFAWVFCGWQLTCGALVLWALVADIVGAK
jgi:hypothetical protein